MSEAIYFSKVEFREFLGYAKEEFRLVLDLVNKELSYQEFEQKRNMPSACGIVTEEWNGRLYNYQISFPMKKVRNGKTNFEGIMIEDEQMDQMITFSYGIRLSDEEMNKLLPYCNALDFEPYRNREMSMDDPGFLGYRDEVNMYFTAITDSFIPKIELPMAYYFDEAHIWPSEKLFRYLVDTFFSKTKKLRGCKIASYGGCSLYI